jgi:hypothetical protein
LSIKAISKDPEDAATGLFSEATDSIIGSSLKALLNGDSHREKIQTQLAMLPVEALQAARQIRIAGCSEEERNRLADLPLEAPLRVLDLVERYHASAEALEECGRLVRTLEIQRYWGDYAL